MAREVVVYGRCDVCGARAEFNDMAMDVPLVFGRSSGELDMCTGCEEAAGKDLAPYLNVMRLETGRKRRKDAKAGGPPSRRASSRVSGRKGGTYDRFLTEDGSGYRCPECLEQGHEWTSASPNALGAHRRKAHGVTARAKGESEVTG